jgi:polyhydroxyalkanoate synthesis regulator phasin
MRTALRRAVAAGAVGLVGVTGVALGTTVLPAAAATDDTTTEDATDDAFRAQHQERLREALESRVEDGTITAAQADEIAATLAEQLGPRGGFGGHGHGERGVALTAAAEALGLSTDELRDALADGSTLADVAEAQGVAVEDLVAALVTAAEERIDDAVADGRLTAEEAEQRKAELTERMTERVESGLGGGEQHREMRGRMHGGADDAGFPGRGMRGGMGGGMGGGSGFGGTDA